MKKYTILILLCANVIVSGCKKTGEPYSGPINSLKRYPFEHFHLTYGFSGDARGSEEVFVAGYGRYEAQINKSEILTAKGVQSANHTIITRFADMYSLDYSRRNLQHIHSGYLDSLYHLDQSDVPSPQQYLEFEMKRNLLKNTGFDTVAGKTVQRFQLIDGNMTMWIWNGMLLRKYAGSQEGYLDMKVTSIDTLWTVDTTKFTIPQGFTDTKNQDPNAAPAN